MSATTFPDLSTFMSLSFWYASPRRIVVPSIQKSKIKKRQPPPSSSTTTTPPRKIPQEFFSALKASFCAKTSNCLLKGAVRLLDERFVIWTHPTVFQRKRSSKHLYNYTTTESYHICPMSICGKLVLSSQRSTNVEMHFFRWGRNITGLVELHRPHLEQKRD